MPRWHRRRDLEGGREIGIWILESGKEIIDEVVIKSYSYRGGYFVLYTIDNSESLRIKLGEYKTARSAFDEAINYICSTEYEYHDSEYE